MVRALSRTLNPKIRDRSKLLGNGTDHTRLLSVSGRRKARPAWSFRAASATETAMELRKRFARLASW